MSENPMTEPATDEEQNLVNLREAKEAAEARIEELIPYAVNDTIRKVGLDPDKGNGVVLKELMGDNPDLEKAQEFITKFGWEGDDEGEGDPTPIPEPTATEQQALDAAQRQQRVASVATSDTPKTLDENIAAAQADLQAVATAPHEQQAALRRTALARVNSLNAQKLVGMFKE